MQPVYFTYRNRLVNKKTPEIGGLLEIHISGASTTPKRRDPRRSTMKPQRVHASIARGPEQPTEPRANRS